MDEGRRSITQVIDRSAGNKKREREREEQTYTHNNSSLEDYLTYKTLVQRMKKEKSRTEETVSLVSMSISGSTGSCPVSVKVKQVILVKPLLKEGEKK